MVTQPHAKVLDTELLDVSVAWIYFAEPRKVTKFREDPRDQFHVPEAEITFVWINCSSLRTIFCSLWVFPLKGVHSYLSFGRTKTSFLSKNVFPGQLVEWTNIQFFLEHNCSISRKNWKMLEVFFFNWKFFDTTKNFRWRLWLSLENSFLVHPWTEEGVQTPEAAQALASTREWTNTPLSDKIHQGLGLDTIRQIAGCAGWAIQPLDLQQHAFLVQATRLFFWL